MKRIVCFLLVLLTLSAGVFAEAENPLAADAGTGRASSQAQILPKGISSRDAAGQAQTTLTVRKSATKKVYLGKKYRIKVPGKAVRAFASGNRKVAVVDKAGIVTLKMAGTAKITMKLSGKQSFVLTLKVTDPAVAQKVIIKEGSKGAFTVGTPFQLTAEVKPATAVQKVKWTSSNKSVATVDANGLVTPKKAGTVKITASAGKVSCTFKAKVKKPGKIELSGYWRKDIETAVNRLEGLKRTDASRYYVTYSNGNVRLAEYQEDDYRSGIGYIYVEGAEQYALFGVSVGMSRSEATAKMQPYEGKGDYSAYDGSITYSPYYPDTDAWLTLYIKSGKVSAMMLNCFTDF